MNSILNKASEYVTGLLSEKLPPAYNYHNLTHTLEVVEAAKEIGENSGVADEDLELILVAAWFHDTGYLKAYEGHEEESAELCREFLLNQDYPLHKTDKVINLILATKINRKPGNFLEEIISDADIAHIGRKGLNSKLDTLREEWNKILNKNFTDFEWLKNNIEFISSNKFYTDYAKKIFEERRIANLAKLQKKLRKEVAEPANNNEENIHKINYNSLIETDSKLKKDKQAERGIETMFRNTMRTHVEFSGLADNKANIMISVNTLLLTAIIAILARKLDANPHLIIPTAIITIVSLTTLIFATIVTRPKITSGIFSKEDIENKKANLLFFGNFYNMDLKNFQWGMNEMMKDKEYLYGSMIKDFYYLGQVLGQKYKYLRYCYNIFMYGLILSVIAFTIAIFLFPEGTNLSPLIE